MNLLVLVNAKLQLQQTGSATINGVAVDARLLKPNFPRS
jgi:hypothetical protein